MAPRSHHDKDIPDDKAIKPTIRVFLRAEFSISPGDAGTKRCQAPFAICRP